MTTTSHDANLGDAGSQVNQGARAVDKNQTIFRTAKTAYFTTLSNVLLLDAKLEMDALGVAVRLLAKPIDWEITFAGLRKMFNMGDARVTRIMKELRAAGFLIATRQRRLDGTLSPVVYYLTDNPAEFDKHEHIKHQGVVLSSGGAAAEPEPLDDQSSKTEVLAVSDQSSKTRVLVDQSSISQAVADHSLGEPLLDNGGQQSKDSTKKKEPDKSSLRSESSDAAAPDLELIADAPIQVKPSKSPYTQEFESFWLRCPPASKRGSKSDAFKAWRGLNGCRPLALEAVDAWNRAEAARLAKSKEPDVERTVPHVATWLRGRRWETLAEVKQDRAAKAAHAKTFAYPLAQDPLEEQLRILRRWQECSSEGRHTGWMASFGPEPGHPDCKIPAELLARAGISVDKLNGHDAENHAMLQPAS